MDSKLPSLFYSIIIFSWDFPFLLLFNFPSHVNVNPGAGICRRKWGFSWIFWCIILRPLAGIISGKEHLVEFLLDFPLGRKVRNFQQLLQGNVNFGKETFRSWNPNFCLGKKTNHHSTIIVLGGGNPSKLSQPLMWLLLTPLKFWFMLLCFILIWGGLSSIQQKMYY